MRHKVVLVLSSLLSFGTLSTQALAGHGHHGLNISIDDDQPVTSCDQLHVRSDNREIARSEDRLTLPPTSSTVRMEASQNGGIYVYGWSARSLAS